MSFTDTHTHLYLKEFNNDIDSNLKKIGKKAISFHTKKNNIIEVKPERKELGFVGIPNKINAGNCNNPAPPPDIAEKVLDKKEIKKIDIFLFKVLSTLNTNNVIK